MKRQRAPKHINPMMIWISESRFLCWPRKRPCRHHQAHRSRHNRAQPTFRHRLPTKVNATGALPFAVCYLERSFARNVVLMELNAHIVIDQCQNASLHIRKNYAMLATKKTLNKRQSVEWKLRKSENNFNPLQWWRWDATYGSVWSLRENMVRASNLPAAKDSSPSQSTSGSSSEDTFQCWKLQTTM